GGCGREDSEGGERVMPRLPLLLLALTAVCLSTPAVASPEHERMDGFEFFPPFKDRDDSCIEAMLTEMELHIDGFSRLETNEPFLADDWQGIVSQYIYHPIKAYCEDQPNPVSGFVVCSVDMKADKAYQLIIGMETAVISPRPRIAVEGALGQEASEVTTYLQTVFGDEPYTALPSKEN
ncbi:MAG: hypothetical protein AAFY59_10445, partial [Pseudomonadota bacterium]